MMSTLMLEIQRLVMINVKYFQARFNDDHMRISSSMLEIYSSPCDEFVENSIFSRNMIKIKYTCKHHFII